MKLRSSLYIHVKYLLDSSDFSEASHRIRKLLAFYRPGIESNSRDITGSYTLQIHLISTISSGNARRWICTMVLASRGLPEKTSCLHLTLAAKAASISITNNTSSTMLSMVAPVLCQHLLDVCVGLAHLHLHIPPTYDIAHIVVAHLP